MAEAQKKRGRPGKKVAEAPPPPVESEEDVEDEVRF